LLELWQEDRGCYWPTSLQEISIPVQAKKIMEVFQELHREGTTIIQATHARENADFGTRLINMLDGKIESDEAI